MSVEHVIDERGAMHRSSCRCATPVGEAPTGGTPFDALVRPSAAIIAALFFFLISSALSSALLAAGGDGGPAAPAVAQPIDSIGEQAFQLLLKVYDYDPEIPLDGRIVERTDNKQGSPREKIVFRGAQGFYVPGYLQIPASSAHPIPCILLLHGWSGSKDHFWGNDNYISGGNVRRALLAEGFAVLALDAQCHGDRIAQNEFAPVNTSGPTGVPARKNYFTQREIYVQTTIDYRRAIDYLKTRREIDSNRIGVFGYSMGGTQTFLLTAADSRIKTAVACAVPKDDSPTSLIAPLNVARGIGTRPFFLVMGAKDEMCPRSEAERLFARMGHPQARVSFFPGTHRISREFVPHAVRWFKEHL